MQRYLSLCETSFRYVEQHRDFEFEVSIRSTQNRIRFSGVCLFEMTIFYMCS